MDKSVGIQIYIDYDPQPLFKKIKRIQFVCTSYASLCRPGWDADLYIGEAPVNLLLHLSGLAAISLDDPLTSCHFI